MNSFELKVSDDWLKKKYGPNVWITKNGGLGWTGKNEEMEKFVDWIFGTERVDYGKKIEELTKKFLSEQKDPPPELAGAINEAFSKHFRKMLA